MIVPLDKLLDPETFGGKAAQLSRAVRAGLPVPPGAAIHPDDVARVARTRAVEGDALERLMERLGGAVAVRSSAIGEDSLAASFAGQHATILNACSVGEVIAAITQIDASVRAASALAYRAKLGLIGEPRMGVVIQLLIPSEIAGVLFTRDPMTGDDVRVIEASWGLGEAVVAGMVTPDRFVVKRGGQVLERTPGEKDLAIRRAPNGGTVEVPVAPEDVERLCLGDSELQALDSLASRCEVEFGDAQDLEFAFAGGRLYLLQSRAITRAG